MFPSLRTPAREKLMWRQSPRLPRQGEVRRLRRCSVLLVLTSALFLNTALPASAATWTIHAQPTVLVNGGPVFFQVKSPVKLESLTGSWLNHQIAFSYDATSKAWIALAGVTFETTPNQYALDLTGTVAGGKQITFSHKFKVTRAKYPVTKVELTVEKKFTEPTPEQLAQIEEGKRRSRATT